MPLSDSMGLSLLGVALMYWIMAGLGKFPGFPEIVLGGVRSFL